MIDIERIARQMTAAEPGGDLETRISARLDAMPRPQPRGTFVLRATGGVLVSVAMVAVILTVTGLPQWRDAFTWRPAPGPLESATDRSASAATPAERDLAPHRTAIVDTRPASSPRVSRALEIPAPEPELSVVELGWMQRRIPALAPVEALLLPGLSFESTQPEPLGITPLTITTLPTTSADVGRQIER